MEVDEPQAESEPDVEMSGMCFMCNGCEDLTDAL